MELKILASDRFLSSYDKAIFSLQYLAEGAIHDFVNRFRANPKTVLQQYDKLAHLRQRIVEIDISRSHRLLARYSNHELILLDMGGHEIVSQYTNAKYLTDNSQLESAPNQFWPEQKSGLFSSFPDRTLGPYYPQEITSDWLFFLEEEQKDVLDTIVTEIVYEKSLMHFVLGGPGTGKTCIILNLLKFFVDCEYCVGLAISDNLISYIEKSTNTNISDRARFFL